MRMKPPARRVLLVSLLALPGPLSAQSLFNAAGLGRPVEAIDGRGRVLGGFGLGLPEGYVSPSDPAAAARLVIPTATLVAQPSWVDASQDGIEAGTIQGTRFPLIGIAYSAFGGMVTMQAGSLFDQRFEGRQVVRVDVGNGTTDVVDEFTQDGGISRIAIGYSRMLNPTLSAGVTLARYTGSTTRTLDRDFADLDLDGTQDFSSRQSWSYSGTAVTAGLSKDFGAFARLAGSVTWSTELTADPSSVSDDVGDLPERGFDLPIEARIGGSALLAPGLVIAFGATYADWSDTEDDFVDDVNAGTVFGAGVGAEFSNFRMLGRRAPLRLGFRRTGIPFTVGPEDGSENGLLAGLGFVFNESNGNVLAAADFGFERGNRSAGALSEDFWRITLGLRLSGF